MNLSAEDEAVLRENLKKCSQETIDAAVSFRKTGNIALITPIVLGILERFAEDDKKPLLKNPSDDMVITDELGFDSLTMVEIVLAVEEAIGTSIDNDDIAALRTLGDIKSYIAKKVA
ncbi:MAG: phosphopantetheine-binding protein [Opitutales bacterium]|nr:phosphopantetheine-binding protein [Opitutales bacterium]